jgi:homoserine O-acetyltransferase
MKAFRILGLTAAFLAPDVAFAQQEGVYVIPKFTFENGAQLDNMKVGYVTYGKLNAAKDNAILLTPGTSSGRSWADPHIGPGKAFDSDKYFLIGVDPIGGGNSSSPKDGLKTEFPRYNIRDMVRAQHELVTKGLGLDRLLAVGGPSMGSFQGIEWGVTYPDFMKGVLLWVPAARSDRHIQAIVDAVEAMITLDPGYQGGAYAENPVEGIKRAGMVYFPWLYSDEYLNTIAADDAFAKAERGFGEAWAKTWDANSIIWRYRASRSHDVAAPYGGDMAKALARVTARAHVMPSMSDRTVPGYLTREMYRGLKNAVFDEIPSIKGHLAASQPPGTAEYAFVSERTKAFLEGLAK